MKICYLCPFTPVQETPEPRLCLAARVLKSEALIDVYGSIDELNSWVGYIAGQLTIVEVQRFLYGIQSDLFTIGSVLAGWKQDVSGLNRWIEEMEARIDLIEKELPPIRNFILPGGSELGSFVHITRSICRRVERQAVALAQHQTVDPIIIKYLNRLSDLFFMLARFINNQGNVEETVWSDIPKKKFNKQK